MELKQISNIINTQLMPNIHGIGGVDDDGNTIIIAEDLSNLVEVGIKIDAENLDASVFKDITKTFIPEIVKTHWDMVKYKLADIPIIKTYEDFVGYRQSVKQKSARLAQDSDIMNLHNGSTYNQDKYNGFDADVRLFGDIKQYEMEWSIPLSMYRNAFSVNGMKELFSYIENCVENDIADIENELAYSTVKMAIVKRAEKRIKLLSAYNLKFSKTLTLANALRDRDFLSWVNETIDNVRLAMGLRSTKYNDGSCLTFTPKDKNKLLLLGQFANASKYNLEGVTYNVDKVALDGFYSIPCWQFASDDENPSFTDISTVKAVGDNDENITIPYVIGVAYDDRALAVAMKPQSDRVHYNARGDFENHWTTFSKCNMYDERENICVFTLE